MFTKIKLIALSIVLMINLFVIPAQAFTEYFDLSKLNQGIIGVNATVDGTMAVRIAKGKDSVDHIVSGVTTLPLEYGEGIYTLYMLRKIDGDRYKVIQKKEVELRLDSPTVLYLQSIQNIKWSTENMAIRKAEELTRDAKTDQEKIDKIYDFIFKNISYDDSKKNNVLPNYLPDIDATIKVGRGICYDYAALFAAMLRSEGIATKLVTGYKNDIEQYHAWNQVYDKEKKTWVTIDITYDVSMEKKEVIKDASLYEVMKAY